MPYYGGGKFPLSTYLAARVRKILADPALWKPLPEPVREWLEIHGDTHWGEFYSQYGVALQKRFLAHFLKGENNGWDKEPPAPTLPDEVRRARSVRKPSEVTCMAAR